jgi:hypothetical protein
MSLKGALLLDFTGAGHAGFTAHQEFGEAIVKQLRNGAENKVVVVIDRGVHMLKNEPHVVADHINLTGGNPLCGVNDPCGERFPIVNGIYVEKFGDGDLDRLPRGIAGGLRPKVVPTKEEMAKLRELGVDFCCYNLVPTMIVAAHAGWKVAAVVLPEGAKLDQSLLSRLTGK